MSRPFWWNIAGNVTSTTIRVAISTCPTSNDYLLARCRATNRCCKATESLLFQRIEAGEMPPTGKIDEELIETIGRWINEGASFAEDPGLDLNVVAAKAKSDSQTHEQLVAERLKRSEATWKFGNA